MIYKFKFEVCTDDNVLIQAKSEESGNFWVAFREFMYYTLAYSKHFRIGKDE